MRPSQTTSSEVAPPPAGASRWRRSPAFCNTLPWSKMAVHTCKHNIIILIHWLMEQQRLQWSCNSETHSFRPGTFIASQTCRAHHGQSQSQLLFVTAAAIRLTLLLQARWPLPTAAQPIAWRLTPDVMQDAPWTGGPWAADARLGPVQARLAFPLSGRPSAYLALLGIHGVVLKTAALQGGCIGTTLCRKVAWADIVSVGQAACASLHSVKPRHASIRLAGNCTAIAAVACMVGASSR